RKVDELSHFVPEGVTVVRFLNIGKNYYALVADNKKHNWVALDAAGADNLIRELAGQDAGDDLTFKNCYSLYTMLWRPIEKFISNKRVMVIPDGSLYYLSFEMLTAKPVSDAAGYVKSSLLSTYAISYHYSFFALEPAKAPQQKRVGFAAFVPGFSDDVKDSYLSSLRADTLKKDNEYLSLLPLPFSVDLAKKIHREMGGALFVGDESTPFAFRSKAGNNSIIHIGTHAEANNLHPEYSRLIFAKDPKHASDSNSVFLFDIYNYDLNSDLTVLTACETGRPGFNDGEGMISMAHAFSYAGSESILTGLWKIDEKASCIITDIFYKNLREGMTKDVALQQAKLSYLSTAKGRTLNPQYWAGLVIMGDTSAVEISGDHTRLYLIAGGLLVLLAGLVFVLVRRRKRIPHV
ncbi:MAG: CHAT domain-containing protein, partial [Chitinophagaceae bacterium]